MLGGVGSVCRAFLPAWKEVFASGAFGASSSGPQNAEKKGLNVWKSVGNFVTLRCRGWVDFLNNLLKGEREGSGGM